ncbi:MAG: NHLP bacteriocin system secretion protein [Vicinamibacterales bacterium]
MSENNPLFRKSALDKLSSPERLDVLMQVTSPKGWLALATMGALLVALIVWSVVGSIPTRLEGQGMLIRGGALREIKAAGAGTLEELSLTQGGTVTVGQLAGRIRRPDVRAGTDERASAARRLQLEAEATKAEHRATQGGLRAQIQSTEEEISRTQSQLAKAEEEVALRRDQLSRGLATRVQVSTAEQQVESIRARISSLQGQIRQNRAQIASLDQQMRAADLRYQAAAGEVKTGVVAEKLVSEITSEVAGRVIELRVKQGDAVQPGQTIAIVEPLDAAMQTIVYFDSRTARQIRAGMEAQISPTEIKREEFGYIKGKVIEVGAAPVTLQKMQSDLANQALAQELYGKVAPIEVRAEPGANTATPSGFDWSTSGGPPFAIAGNSRINVSVVVERRAPYTYVLPMIKSALGAS